MSERSDMQELIEKLHAARVSGNLPALCDLFAAEGRYRIAGASADKPISIDAVTLDTFRPWLSMMVKVFRVSNYALTSLVVEGRRAAALWHADI